MQGKWPVSSKKIYIVSIFCKPLRELFQETMKNMVNEIRLVGYDNVLASCIASLAPHSEGFLPKVRLTRKQIMVSCPLTTITL